MSFSLMSSMGSYTTKIKKKAQIPITSIETARQNAYFAFNAQNYDVSTKTFTDLSPNGRHRTFTGTTSPSKVSYVQGATTFTTAKTYDVVSGVATDVCILFPQSLTTYTFIAVSRQPSYNNIASSIFSAPTNVDWACGYWTDRAGVSVHNNTFVGGVTTNKYSFNMWLCNDYSTGFRRNGTLVGTITTTNIKANSGINASSSGGRIFNIAEILCFDYVLTTTEMQVIETYLMNTYGIVSGS